MVSISLLKRASELLEHLHIAARCKFRYDRHNIIYRVFSQVYSVIILRHKYGQCTLTTLGYQPNKFILLW